MAEKPFIRKIIADILLVFRRGSCRSWIPNFDTSTFGKPSLASPAFPVKYRITLLLFFILYTLYFVPSVQAVTVSKIETIPVQPAFGQKFECIISVDVDDYHLACDLISIADPDSKKPWDICPKVPGLGYQYTSNNKRHYNCIADSSTQIPGPGNYRIVAWNFVGDGETGEVIFTKNITILDRLPPTPVPTNTQTPTRKPTKPPKTDPTATVIPFSSPTKAGVPPGVISSPTKVEEQPTVHIFPVERQSLISPLPSDFKRPLFTSFPNFSEIYKLAGVSSKIKYVPSYLREKSYIVGKNIVDYYRLIFINFFRETDF